MSVMAADSKGRRLRRTFTDASKEGELRLILEEGKTASPDRLKRTLNDVHSVTIVT